VAHLLFLISHLIVIVVLARRFFHRQSTPPPTFVLVGTGVVAGLIGAVINTGIAWDVIGPVWDLVGRRMLTEGMVLLLVLGIGGFLGPRLMGFAEPPKLMSIGVIFTPPPLLIAARWGTPLYAAAGVTILATIFLEYRLALVSLAWLRAVVATALIAASVQPWRLPAARTTLASCVWIAHWFLISALWVVAAVPRYQIDFLHLMFMGAFTLLILAVGTRVVLSHGGHPLAEENKSWPIRIGLTTGLIAMLARLGAPFAPNSYFAHLAWAALLWICGIVFWGVYVIGRIKKSARS
jgi:hypothetical protein